MLRENERVLLNKISDLIANTKDIEKIYDFIMKNREELNNFDADIVFDCLNHNKIDLAIKLMENGFDINKPMNKLYVASSSMFLDIDENNDLTKMLLADGDIKSFKVVEKKSNIDKKELFIEGMFYFYQWAKACEKFSKPVPDGMTYPEWDSYKELSRNALSNVKESLKYLANEYKLTMDTVCEKYDKTLGKIAQQFEQKFESKQEKSKYTLNI